MLDGALHMGHKLGGPGFQWKVSEYFLNWCLPWYMAALQNALGTDAVRKLIPVFLEELQKAIRTRAEIDQEFPVEDFLILADDISESYLAGIMDGREPGAAEADQPTMGMAGGVDGVENQIAEVAFNIVRVAYRVGSNQFKTEEAGEAATWILAMASSSFLRGLEVSMGEKEVALYRPGFFSRLRHELREQYEEFPGYPLSHFLDIASSIGKKWMQLSTEGDLAGTPED